MSKKNALDPREVQNIINDYLQALRLARGPQAADETELYYKKGWFYLRPSDYSGTLGIPYRPQKIKDMTAELRKLIPPRPDSDSDGEPD